MKSFERHARVPPRLRLAALCPSNTEFTCERPSLAPLVRCNSLLDGKRGARVVQVMIKGYDVTGSTTVSGRHPFPTRASNPLSLRTSSGC